MDQATSWVLFVVPWHHMCMFAVVLSSKMRYTIRRQQVANFRDKKQKKLCFLFGFFSVAAY